MFIRITLAALTCASLAAASASARDARVDTSDIDFADPAQVAVAYDRVEAFVNRRCEGVTRGSLPSSGVRKSRFETLVQECVDRALAETFDASRIVALNDLHERRLAARDEDTMQMASR